MSSVPRTDLDEIIDCLDPLWPSLAGTRILITGGTGFFGIWLLETLREANRRLGCNIRVSVVSRDPSVFLARHPHLADERRFRFIKGSPASFRFPRTDHDHILHLATATSAIPEQTNPATMLDQKMRSMNHVLEYCRRSGSRRLLVTSSGAIYGQQPSSLERMPETYSGGPEPTLAASAYGQGKRLVEQLCSLAPEVTSVIARCFTFMGPHLPLDARFAAGNFLRDAAQGRAIIVKGDGTAQRSYLYAADLAIWLITLLVRGTPGRAYNVGHDAAVSTGDLARKIAVLAGPASTVRILGSPSIGATPHRYLPDITRANQELGLRPRIDLDEAIRRSLAWLRAPSPR